MKSTVSATHLLKAFLLFALVTLFLLTMTRAGLSLWQLHLFDTTEDFRHVHLDDKAAACCSAGLHSVLSYCWLDVYFIRRIHHSVFHCRQ